jgi:hypothetical protein
LVCRALVYLNAMGAWSVHAVIATVLGAFISMLLGCGIFALAFFSDNGGHDEDVTTPLQSAAIPDLSFAPRKTPLKQGQAGHGPR